MFAMKMTVDIALMHSFVHHFNVVVFSILKRKLKDT